MDSAVIILFLLALLGLGVFCLSRQLQASASKGEWDSAQTSTAFEVEVVGESFRNPDGQSRQDIIAKLAEGERVQFVREPDNPHDRNAIAIQSRIGQIGYVSREDASLLAPKLDAGRRYRAQICGIAGGTKSKPSRGVWLIVDVE